MDKGWIKLHRKMRRNPVFKKPAYLAVFIHILMLAVFEKTYVMYDGKKLLLRPGQCTTGAYVLAKISGVPRGTVERIIKTFQNEELIEVQTDGQCSLITVINWDRFQSGEEVGEERVRNEWGTGEERVRTKEEYKNIRTKENTKAKEKFPEFDESLYF